MFLSQIENKKTGRIFLQIVESYRKDGRSHQRKVKALGYLDELQKEYEDPIAHFKEVARQMTEEAKADKANRVLTLSAEQRLVIGEERRKNIGYFALSTLFHQLEIDAFVNNRRRYLTFEGNLNHIFQGLVFNRAIDPSSKLGAWKARGKFLDKHDYSLEQVYRSLGIFLSWRDDLIRHLDSQIKKRYGREDLLTYYDVTNYYFESDREDELRIRGRSKERRKRPIIQMGLFIDGSGLPVTYDLFRGNANDSITLPQMMDQSVFQLNAGHTIYVADRGVMSGNNISRIRMQHDGYVISHTARGADKRFKEWIIRDVDTDPVNERFVHTYDKDGNLIYKVKSRITPRLIKITDMHGRITEQVINERQVVVYSTKYDLKSKYERQVLIEKAEEQIMSLSKEAKNPNYGANKYVKKALLDKKTGEVKTKGQVYVSSLDEEKIDNDEKYDGYYVLCTNVIGLEEWEKPFGKSHRYTKDGFFQLNKPVTAEDILEIYHGLWRIEETFKVTKSALRTRPVYVWTEEHIRSHFLICFVTLLLFRLLQKRLDWKYSAETIQETLSKASGTLVDNVYIFDHFDEPLKDIGKNLGIDFSRQNLTVGEVRSLLAYVKQSS